MFENVPTVSSAERQQVRAALERLQAKLVQREEWTHSDTLGNLKEKLQSPMFSHILTLQHSIKQLRNQLNTMPPDACSEFSFSKNGQLIMSAVDPASRSAVPTLSTSSSVLTNDSALVIHPTPPSSALQKWILAAARGRPTQLVTLTRPPSGSLGFSVVGLSPAGSVTQGVFVKQIQPGGVAHRDGRLQERDQILVINSSPLEQGISHQQALALLQQPGETVDLVVARDRPPDPPLLPATPVNTDQWGHVEEIELLNDGSGLGFGIVGGKSSGVVVRTIIPNSVAEKDGRLRTGDHILRIGVTPTMGLTSDQVVRVLQGCGSKVNLLVARDLRGQRSTVPPPPPPPTAAPVSSLPHRHSELLPQRRASKLPNLEGYEIYEVPLTKNEGQSLGISIIGFNPLTSQDAVGVYVKSIVPGSAADQSGKIKVHDRLIAMDGVSLHGLTNQEVVEVMKQTGQSVVLTLVRRKPKGLERSLDRVERESSRLFAKRSQEVKACSAAYGTTMTKPDPTYPNTKLLNMEAASEAQLRAKWEQALGPHYQVLVVKLDPIIEDDTELQKSSKLLPIHTLRLGVELDSFDGHHYISSVAPGGPVDRHGLLRPEDELLEVNDVQLYGKSRREVVSFLKEVPPPFTLVCCRHPITDLEPTSESESEPEPESILRPKMGLGRGQERQSQSHVEEIELKLSSMLSSQPVLGDDSSQQHHGPRQEVSPVKEVLREEPIPHRAEDEEDEDGELALWSPHVQVLELQKEKEKGLGFSILDYQDPLDPNKCVMVIRSLVPGGSAERHGGLLPGDQLVSVNQTQLDLLTLAQAVEVLKSAPPGTVCLGIRKPLVVEAPELRQQDSSPLSLTSTSLRVPKGFGDGSIVLEDLRKEKAEEEEPELILDGDLPRYVSSYKTPDLQLVNEGKEMAVDDYEGEEEKSEERMEDTMGSLPIKPPPSWEEWKLSSFTQAGRIEDNLRIEKHDDDEDPLRSDRDSIVSMENAILDFPDYRDREADSELTLTDTDTESVRRVDMTRRKRRSQGASQPIRGGHSDLPEREEGEGEETPVFSHWGPPRRVEVWPEDGQSLGLSIVGGRHVIKRLRNGEELKGIFIKQVLPNSAAAKTQCLKTGDKILEVSGVDLRAASHEEAVGAIKSAPSPVVFVVQSLSATPRPVSLLASSYSKHKAKRTNSPKPESDLLPLRQPPPYRPPNQSDQELSSDFEDVKGLV